MIECPKCHCEHEPMGMHDEDAGEWECENCGFVFVVEIDYDLIYDSECVNHKFPTEFEKHNEQYEKRHCEYCGKCELKEIGQNNETISNTTDQSNT